MDLSKKTTILFQEDEYRQLTEIAKARHSSVGSLVREACEAQYGLHPSPRSGEAVKKLSELSLPVGDTRSMKQESVPAPGDLLP